MMPTEDKKPENKKSKLPLYLSLFIVIAVVASYFIFPSVEAFLKEAWNVLTSNDEAQVKQWVEGFGWFGPIVIVLAMVIQMFLLVIPTILLMVVTILAYGPLWGSIIIYIAIFIASSVGFWLGRYFGDSLIIPLLGKSSTKKVTGFIKNYGFWAVVITRVNPFLSNDAISFVAGILKMGYWKFILATTVGIAPLITLIALTGENIDSMKMGLLWGSIGSLVIFGIYIWWDKKRKA